MYKVLETVALSTQVIIAIVGIVALGMIQREHSRFSDSLGRKAQCSVIHKSLVPRRLGDPASGTQNSKGMASPSRGRADTRYHPGNISLNHTDPSPCNQNRAHRRDMALSDTLGLH